MELNDILIAAFRFGYIFLIKGCVSAQDRVITQHS